MVWLADCNGFGVEDWFENGRLQDLDLAGGGIYGGILYSFTEVSMVLLKDPRKV